MSSDTTPEFPRDPDAFVRPAECARFLGIGLSTLWSWSSTGKLPKPIKLGPKTSVWQAGIIRNLQKQLIEQGQQ